VVQGSTLMLERWSLSNYSMYVGMLCSCQSSWLFPPLLCLLWVISRGFLVTFWTIHYIM